MWMLTLKNNKLSVEIYQVSLIDVMVIVLCSMALKMYNLPYNLQMYSINYYPRMYGII